jgi:hypothetical protein
MTSSERNPMFYGIPYNFCSTSLAGVESSQPRFRRILLVSSLNRGHDDAKEIYAGDGPARGRGTYDGCRGFGEALSVQTQRGPVGRYGRAARLARGQEVSAEAWRPVPEWEGIYWVSDLGRLRSAYTPDRILIGAVIGRGYRFIMLCDGKRRRRVCVHRLVLEAFVGPQPPGCEGCHNDGKPGNNRLDNLRWDTHKGNQADRRRHGTNSMHKALLTDPQVIRIRTERDIQDRDWAALFGVCIGTIRNARQGKTFRHVLDHGFHRPRPYR